MLVMLICFGVAVAACGAWALLMWWDRAPVRRATAEASALEAKGDWRGAAACFIREIKKEARQVEGKAADILIALLEQLYARHQVTADIRSVRECRAAFLEVYACKPNAEKIKALFAETQVRLDQALSNLEAATAPGAVASAAPSTVAIQPPTISSSATQTAVAASVKCDDIVLQARKSGDWWFRVAPKATLVGVAIVLLCVYMRSTMEREIKNESHFREIKIGMTEAQVRQTMGKPDSVVSTAGLDSGENLPPLQEGESDLLWKTDKDEQQGVRIGLNGEVATLIRSEQLHPKRP